MANKNFLMQARVPFLFLTNAESQKEIVSKQQEVAATAAAAAAAASNSTRNFKANRRYMQCKQRRKNLLSVQLISFPFCGRGVVPFFRGRREFATRDEINVKKYETLCVFIRILYNNIEAPFF